MNVNINFSLLIILLIIQNSNNYIVLPFKSTKIPFKESNNISTIENFLSQIDTNQLYTTLSFGSPSKNIDFYLSMDQLAFSILSNNCIKGSYSSYDPSLSNTFINQTAHNYTLGPISKASLATDKCTFYNNMNLSQNISFDALKFLLGNNSSPKTGKENIDSQRLCGIIGLMRYSYNTFLTMNNFIYYLKSNKIINSYKWGLYFFNTDNNYNVDKKIQSEYDGYLIAGITNDSYLDIFNTDNVYTAYAYSTLFWTFNFNKVYYNDSENEYNCGNNTIIDFVIDMNYISSTRIYYESIKKYFFSKYLDEKICVEEKVNKLYEDDNFMIICDLKIKPNLSSFPKIYFYSEQLSYIFSLDYNDVFIELNNKIYFLIIFKEAINTIWRVGKIFMRKYPFIFDYDQKTISIVNFNKNDTAPNEPTNKDKKDNNIDNNNKNNNDNIFLDFKIYIVIFLLIIAVIIGVFIGKKIWQKQRKMRANELDDNYEYIEKFDIEK